MAETEIGAFCSRPGPHTSLLAHALNSHMQTSSRSKWGKREKVKFSRSEVRKKRGEGIQERVYYYLGCIRVPTYVPRTSTPLSIYPLHLWLGQTKRERRKVTFLSLKFFLHLDSFSPHTDQGTRAARTHNDFPKMYSFTAISLFFEAIKQAEVMIREIK